MNADAKKVRWRGHFNTFTEKKHFKIVAGILWIGLHGRITEEKIKKPSTAIYEVLHLPRVSAEISKQMGLILYDFSRHMKMFIDAGNTFEAYQWGMEEVSEINDY